MQKRPDMRGLGARLRDSREAEARHPVDTFTDDADAGKVVNIPVGLIAPNPDQPRKFFDPQALHDLTESVRERGVLQPIIVRRNLGEDSFTLIAGERRWRASKAAGLTKVPALIRQKEDPAEIALIENLQREDLNAIEEAESLQRLKDRRGLTDNQLARIVGKSRATITESLSLNRLPESVKAECRRADIYSKRQLLQVLREPNTSAQLALWDALRGGRLTGDQVRAARKLANDSRSGPRPYEYKFYADDHSFAVRVKFRKSRASHDDIRTALRDALRDVT